MTASEPAIRQDLGPESSGRRRYKVGKLLGAGGMARVYEARDMRLQRDVAIKVNANGQPESNERLRREGIAMAAINSRHVVTIYDVLQCDDELFLIMQRVRGLTMRDEVRALGPMDVRRACRLTVELLSGLSALHAAGLLHRDVKPSNIMIDLDDHAVLLDLGIALRRRQRRLTPVGMAIGTLEAVAPEQLLGMASRRSDLFQVGLVLAYMITGFELDPAAHYTLADLERMMPEPLAAVVARALAPVDHRFESATDMAAAIERAVARLAPAPGKPTSASVRSGRRRADTNDGVMTKLTRPRATRARVARS